MLTYPCIRGVTRCRDGCGHAASTKWEVRGELSHRLGLSYTAEGRFQACAHQWRKTSWLAEIGVTSRSKRANIFHRTAAMAETVPGTSAGGKEDAGIGSRDDPSRFEHSSASIC